MPVFVHALERDDIPAMKMPDRFRHDITYFATPAGANGAPASLAEGEYWIRREDARSTFDDGVIRLVSPLDSEHTTEIEITEEQERWLEWMIQHDLQHVRLSTTP